MIRHIVAEGQTPHELAESYGVPLAELVKLNGLTPGQPIPPGVMLWVPEVAVPGVPCASDPVLSVPPDLFTILCRLQDPSGSGTLILRIVRGAPEQPITLRLP